MHERTKEARTRFEDPRQADIDSSRRMIDERKRWMVAAKDKALRLIGEGVLMENRPPKGIT